MRICCRSGMLGPTPGEGKPRASRLTEDEQRTMITLWAMARSPLFVGGNLTQMDDTMKSLLTNPGVIEVDQHSLAAAYAGAGWGCGGVGVGVGESG